MKEKFILLWGIIFTIAFIPFNGYGYDFEVDGIYYNIISQEKKELEVTHNVHYAYYATFRLIDGYLLIDLMYLNHSYSGNIIIPEEVNFDGNIYKVTRIGSSAFGCNCYYNPRSCIELFNDLEKIEFENGLDLNPYVCDIQSVTLPNSIREIGSCAFQGTQIENIELPSGVTLIEQCAFSWCENLKQINWENLHNTAIKDDAFSGCNKIEEINLSGITKIGWETFSDCSNLKNINFGNLLDIINVRSFRNCSSLEFIKIPNSIKYIDDGAFKDCAGLKIIEMGTPNSALNGDVLYDGNVTYDGNVFEGCLRIETVISNYIVPPYWDDSSKAFSRVVYPAATLIIPKGSLRYYKNTKPWNNFNNIEEKDIYENTNSIESDFFDLNDTFNVFSPSGILIGRRKTATELKDLPKGIYVIVCGNKRFKISV